MEIKKVYVRELRPMIKPPALQGFDCEPSPLIPGKHMWFDEDEIEEFLEGFEQLVKLKDPMGTLVLEERYRYIGEVDIKEIIK